MNISPDAIIFWNWGPVALNATIVYTWVVMVLLVAGSYLITRRLCSGIELPPWQNLLEVIVVGIREQIEQVSHQRAGRYLPFVGTLFVFIAASSLLNVVPGYIAPTGSLSTAMALAFCVFIAVPLFGLSAEGPAVYLRHYIKPTWFMLPFNIIGELSRTIALAVRLYGNIMSGSVIAAILLSLTPYFFPVLMQLLGLLTGMIQAYIFSILAMVYIASATSNHDRHVSDESKHSNS